MRSAFWLLLPLACHAKVTVYEVFDVHPGSCRPHYEKLEIVFTEAQQLAKEGNDNIEYLLTTSNEPNQAWHDRQTTLMNGDSEQWQGEHPQTVMWVLHYMRTYLAATLFGTTFVEEELRAMKPDLTNPSWFVESTLSPDDVATLGRAQANLQLLYDFLFTPKPDDKRVFLACSQDVYIPHRTLQVADFAPAISRLTIQQPPCRVGCTFPVTALAVILVSSGEWKLLDCARSQSAGIEALTIILASRIS